MKYQFGYVQDGEFVLKASLDNSNATISDYRQMMNVIIDEMLHDKTLLQLVEDSGEDILDVLMGPGRVTIRDWSTIKIAFLVFIGGMVSLVVSCIFDLWA